MKSKINFLKQLFSFFLVVWHYLRYYFNINETTSIRDVYFIVGRLYVGLGFQFKTEFLNFLPNFCLYSSYNFTAGPTRAINLAFLCTAVGVNLGIVRKKDISSKTIRS